MVLLVKKLERGMFDRKNNFLVKQIGFSQISVGIFHNQNTLLPNAPVFT